MTESQSKTESLMNRYLLGEVTELERGAIEKEYFADPQSFDRMLAAEHDLIEAYVCDKLSEKDRADFERHYLSSPERRKQVEFFQTLAQALPLEASDGSSKFSSETISMPWWRRIFSIPAMPKPAMAAAAALVLLCVWLSLETRQLRQQTRQSARERAAFQAREQALIEQLAIERAKIREQVSLPPTPTSDQEAPPPKIVSFAWTLSGLRTSEPMTDAARTLILPAGTDLAQLSFRLPSATHSEYQVKLLGPNEQVFWQRTRLKPIAANSGAIIMFYVPAMQFRPGRYSLLLSGDVAAELGEFPIEVRR